MFSICYAKNGGYMSFGKQNEKSFINEGKEVSIVGSSMYQTTMNGLTLGGSKMDLSKYRMVLDSGTTIVYFPGPVYDFIVSSFENNFQNTPEIEAKHYSNGDNMPCFKSTAKLQSLKEFLPVMDFSQNDDSVLIWRPEAYLEKSEDGFCIAMTRWGSDEALLGTTFFVNHNITFDLNRRKVILREANCNFEDLGYLEISSGKTYPKPPVEAEKPNNSAEEPDKKPPVPNYEPESKPNYIQTLISENYIVLLCLLGFLLLLCCYLVRKSRSRIEVSFSKLENEGVRVPGYSDI